MNVATLVLMSRWPEPGRTKTRLIPTLGAEGAARLHRAFLMDLLDRFSTLDGIDRVLAVTGERPMGSLALEIPHPFRVIEQPPGDLGERLFLLSVRHPGPVIFIGADAPTLPLRFLIQAVRTLDHVDAVFQPAMDGGYTLAAFREPCRSLLTAIPWGTDRVLATTLARARSDAIAVALLDPWYDVDTEDDLARLARYLRAQGANERAQNTAAVLADLEKQL